MNEPWGTTPENLAVVMGTLYQAIREVDQNHVIILPGHSKGIDAYGKPSDHGMTNVAFEMHPYPGHFGWGKPGLDVHQGWLQCVGDGDNVCKWSAKLKGLDTAFFVGEFQPWAFMGAQHGGQVMRVTYDTYVANGRASTAWAYKLVTSKGGQGKGTWGLVTNAPGAAIPKLDFTTAPLADIQKRLEPLANDKRPLHAFAQEAQAMALAEKERFRHYIVAEAEDAPAKPDADSLLAELEISPETAQVPVKSLSGGQHTRLLLARALLHEPNVLLLDEPLSALDEELRDELAALLKRVQRDLGLTALHITHSRHEAAQLADVMFRMEAGRVTESR